MKKLSLPMALAALAITTACPSDDPGTTGTADETGDTTSDPSGSPTSSPTSSPTTDPDTSVGPTDPDTSVGPATDTDSTTTSGAEEAQIRVVHAAAGAPNVDVYVAGTDKPVISDLAYGDASDYLTVPAGTYAFDVRAAGSDPADPPAHTTPELDLAADATVTAVAAGLLGSKDEAAAFRVLPLVEGFADPGAGNAAVRIVHAGADAPTVDINVGNDGGDPELPGVPRFADSGAEGVPLPAGAALQVGIESGGAVVTAFTTPELPEGANLFVIATGLLGDMPREESGFSLLAIGPDGAIGRLQQNPRVHAFHGGTDVPPVDVCVGDDLLIEGASFGALAGVQVPPGAYDLEFHVSPGDCTAEPAVIANTGDLAAGQQYLGAVIGELAPNGNVRNPFSLRLAAYQEQFDLEAAPEASLSIIHGATFDPVQVGVVDENGQVVPENVLVGNVAFPNASDLVSVPAGQYEVAVLPAAVPLPFAPSDSLTAPISEGLRAWVIAVGDGTPEAGDEPLQFFAIVAIGTEWAALAL